MHPLIARILQRIDLYENNKLDIPGLQKDLWLNYNAMENDVPLSIRDFMEKLDGKLEKIRFLVVKDKQRQQVFELIKELKNLIKREMPYSEER